MHVTYFFYWWSSLYNVQIMYIQTVYCILEPPMIENCVYVYRTGDKLLVYTVYTPPHNIFSIRGQLRFHFIIPPPLFSLPSILYTLISRSLPPCILLSTYSHPSSFHPPPPFPFPSPPSSPLFFQSFPFNLPCLFLLLPDSPCLFPLFPIPLIVPPPPFPPPSKSLSHPVSSIYSSKVVLLWGGGGWAVGR
jgi:hypothetical protein